MLVDSYGIVPWAFKDIFYISIALHLRVRIPHLLLLSHTDMCLLSLSTFKQELQKLEEGVHGFQGDTATLPPPFILVTQF